MKHYFLVAALVVTGWWTAAPTTVAATAETLTLQAIPDDLPLDEHGKLSSHVLVYHDTPACQSVAATFTPSPADFFVKAAVSGQVARDLFGSEYDDNDDDNDTTACQAVCLEQGVDRSVVATPLPNQFYHADEEPSFAKWFRDTCTGMEVCVLNYVNRQTPLKLYWIPPETHRQKVLHLEIEYGERKTRCFHSYLGHEFQGVDGETDESLGFFTVRFNTVLAFGISPSCDDPSRHVGLEHEIHTTLHNEWIRHNRVTRTFSPLGFQLGRLPDDVFGSMGAFYYNNRHHKVREEWQGKGVFVNWWESDVSFIPIPWGLKSQWQQRLRDLVEAWAGVPVEQTDMYGLRQYEAGARLLTHVDRESTHAVSLIVNIAQGNLTEPWPVEVQDHADRLHEVIMKPGDVVYYESAKCLHGRNRPLMGPQAYYVNLFTHYRPVGDPKWFLKPNDPFTPEPLLQADGACRLEQVRTMETADHQLGVIEAVQCDDPRLGRHISPSLFTATSGDDLIQWWRMTGGLAEEALVHDDPEDDPEDEEEDPEEAAEVAADTAAQGGNDEL